MIRVPPHRLRQDDTSTQRARAARNDRRHLILSDSTPVMVHDHGSNNNAGLRAELTTHLRPHRDRRPCIGDCRSRHVRSPTGNVYRSGGVDPHVAIDPRARIPTRGVGLGRQSNREHIRLIPEMQVRRQIESEPTVSVGSAAQLMAVEPHGGVGHGAVELDGVVLSHIAGRKPERLAVPTDAGDGQCSGVRVE